VVVGESGGGAPELGDRDWLSLCESARMPAR
jgi:hypothetical protein